MLTNSKFSVFNQTKKIYIIPFIGLFFSISAVANVTDDTATDEDIPMAYFDPIIVTARGLEEDRLETPFVVNTITPQEIEDNNYIDVEDAVHSDPNIDIHNGGNVAYSMLWMRGTGSLSMTSLDDNSVDILIDGISNGKTGLGRNLIDIEQVEIAKGPQGTLHGGSSEAGSILVTTTNPQDYFDIQASVGIGNHEQRYGDAILNVPLSDNIAMRIAGMSEKKDNYLLKAENGEPLNKQESQGVQAKLGWHDDEYTNEVVLGLYHDEQTNNVPMLQKDFSTYKIATFDLPHESENTTKGATLTVKRDMGFANIESHTGYHNYDASILRPFLPPEMLSLQYAGFGITPSDQPTYNAVFAQQQSNRQLLIDDIEQFSQELTLTSKPEDELKWVAGLYFAKKERRWFNDGRADLSALPNGGFKAYLSGSSYNGITDKTYDSTTKAMFGEITYPVTDELDVIAGIRVANEELEHRSNWQGNTNNPLGSTVKSDSKTLDDTATTGRLGLSYAINPNWYVYGLQSRGHKFGGFADYDNNVTYGNPVAVYKPTEIDATEVGTKFRSADNRLNLGLALYQNTMKDDHITVLGAPPAYKSESANVDSRSRGIELSADWRATDNWQLTTTLAYTDTEVTDASDIPVPARPGMLPLTAKGNRMPQVPEFSGSVGIRYSDDLPNSLLGLDNTSWFVDANYRYVGERYAQAYNAIELDSYGLVDASIGLISTHHELGIWGKNLTNEDYKLFTIYPQNVGTLAPDRSYGVKYSYYY